MKQVAVFIIFLSISIVACKKKGCTDPNADNYNVEAQKDDGSCAFAEVNVPTTYSFTDANGNNTVDYAEQTDLINQLDELLTYAESGTSGTLSFSTLYAMFVNTGGNGGGNFSFSSTASLRDNCLPSDTAFVVSLLDSLATSSADFASTASSGQAGTLTSGTHTYLFSSKGIQYLEFIEKAVMGGIFYYQATNVHLGDDAMNTDNTTAVDASAGKYCTEQEHHWDQAFGYLGVPVNFPTNTTDIFFWGEYCDARDADLGCNTIFMNAFLKGRALISQGFDASLRNEQLTVIRQIWEKLSAAQAVEYLKEARDNFGTDNAKFLHQLSEGYGFIRALKYAPPATKLITDAQVDDLLTNVIGDNFWAVTYPDLTNAINQLSSIYGL